MDSENFSWAVVGVIVVSFMVMIGFMFHVTKERDMVAIKAGLVQKVEQATTIWVKP